MIAGFGACFTSGSASLASIWIGFGSGLGFGISIFESFHLQLGRLGVEAAARRRSHLHLRWRRRSCGERSTP